MSVVFPKFTMGADPELALEYRGHFIEAKSVIDEGYNHDFATVESKCGNVGLDGNECIAEIRPAPAYMPLELVKNIQTTMANSCKQYPHLAAAKWLCGSSKGGHTIGGHIHFGIHYKDAVSLSIPTALDIYLAPFAMMLENSAEAKTRKKTHGSLTDCRQQPWGFEYRTPASWIDSPGTSLAVLSLTKHIANQAVINSHTFDTLNYLDMFDIDMWMVREKYDDHNLNFFRKFLIPLWSNIMSWPIEPGLEQGLEIMAALIKNKYKYSKDDIKKNWGVHVSFS